MLQEAIASVEDYDFEIESILAKQLGAVPLPFPGMDSMLYYHIEIHTQLDLNHLHHREQGSIV